MNSQNHNPFKLSKKLISAILMAVFILAGCAPAVNSGTGSAGITVPGQTTAAQGTQSKTDAGTQTAKTQAANTQAAKTQASQSNPESPLSQIKVAADGRYTSKMEVAAYLYQFKKLPANFITKNKASDLGWKASEGNLWKVTDKMSIGGDKFGNFEELLPKKSGRQYYECDINYKGGSRGAERIVYSNDGLIFYTKDHYKSFEQLN